MAKQKNAEEQFPEDEGKVPVQVRLDAELHERLKKVAEEAGISMNQLINGMCWGLIEKAVPGEAMKNSSGFVSASLRKKCLFFGEAGWTDGDEPDAPVVNPGHIWFKLDFTNRGVVR